MREMSGSKIITLIFLIQVIAEEYRNSDTLIKVSNLLNLKRKIKIHKSIKQYSPVKQLLRDGFKENHFHCIYDISYTD